MLFEEYINAIKYLHINVPLIMDNVENMQQHLILSVRT